MPRPSLRLAVGLAGLAAIVGLACLPSLRTAWMHGREVFSGWQSRMLLSPAFWIWLWTTWLAVALPWTLVGRAMPLVGSAEATPRFLATTLGAFTVIAMGVAVFWHFVAWGAYPVLDDQSVRLVPFWPWPSTGFTRWVLGFEYP